MARVLATYGIEAADAGFLRRPRLALAEHRDRPQAGRLLQIIEACARHGIRAISPWRDQVAIVGLDAPSRGARAWLELSGYCRGGMFPADAAHRRRRATTTAAPSTRPRRSARPASCSSSAACRNIRGRAARPRTTSRWRASQVEDGIAELLDYAQIGGMPLAIEPLHPMYAADRACVNTSRTRSTSATGSIRKRTGALGVALDVYHVWWDPDLMPAIAAPATPGCSPSMSATGWCRRETCCSTAA